MPSRYMGRLAPSCLLVLLACVQAKPGTDRADAGSVTTRDAGETTPPRDAGETLPPRDGGETIEPDAGELSDGGFVMDAATPDSGVEECIPTGPEVCDNGLDDDCANGIDCNDLACGACVPVPNSFALGVMVAAGDACPAGFAASETPLYAGLDPGAGCAGTCNCSPNPTVCLGELFMYSTQAQCNADTALTGGQRYAGTLNAQCTSQPVFDGFPGGFRLGNWTVQQSCTASGVASPSPYQWMSEGKFCVAEVGQQGCAADAACVPAAASTDACVITTGGAACPAEFSERVVDWYTGLSDNRTCGPCQCSASGGSCQFARISLGSDWSCTDDMHLSLANPKICMSNYSPPARVTGFPGDPTCTAGSQQMGTIQATGQQTLCCQP